MLKLAFLLFVSLAVIGSVQAQQATYPLPKYAPKYGMETKDFGPRPGSTAPDDNATATFKRIYNKPAQLRLFVRAKCGTAIRQNDLIDRAKSATLAKGPVVQIDWETVRDERAAFWAVMSAEKITVTLDLVAKDGKFAVQNTTENKQEIWQAARVSIQQANCVREKDVEVNDIRRAVMQTLLNTTLKHFRGQIR